MIQRLSMKHSPQSQHLFSCLVWCSVWSICLLPQTTIAIVIPSIPRQHLLCWYRNVDKSVQQELFQSCNNGQYEDMILEEEKEGNEFVMNEKKGLSSLSFVHN